MAVPHKITSHQYSQPKGCKNAIPGSDQEGIFFMPYLLQHATSNFVVSSKDRPQLVASSNEQGVKLATYFYCATILRPQLSQTHHKNHIPFSCLLQQTRKTYFYQIPTQEVHVLTTYF
jgi:hypothetical protein